MTEIWLHIGPESQGTLALQTAAQTADWTARGWLYPQDMGQHGQTALALAALDPDHVDPLRWARGLAPEDRHAAFQAKQRTKLAEIAAAAPKRVILSCDLLGRDLHSPSEHQRLRDLLAPISDRITVLIHRTPAPEALAAHWSGQILWGRCTPLETDLPRMRADARPRLCARPEANVFPELELAPTWLDPERLAVQWRNVFADVRVVDLGTLATDLGLILAPPPPLPSAQTLARLIELNRRLRPALDHGLILPRKHRARLAARLATDGAPLDPTRIAAALAGDPAPLLPPLHDFDPDATAAKILPKLLKLTRAADIGQDAPAPEPVDPPPHLPPEAQNRYARLVHSRYAPHNRIAPPPAPETPFAPAPKRMPERPERVIIACMKDEGPYILEWLAYHRMIGIDHFVIYTNDCSDGTDTLLETIAQQGWLTHVDNSDWHGTSPQQAALNRAITLPVVAEAAWVLHIDVDEFVNIRVGNGTFDDLFAACPTATHFALTWRLFGSNGITRIENAPVIGQFTRCAPAFCPKPHTVWGFKTLGRQIGAYGKLSCHRPTKPIAAHLSEVQWVNGSGQPMGPEIAEKGWRNSIRSIGYDLVQLNHYALRSRDSFLVKRKRGRALHVARQIGHNYWVRMDWNDHEDRSILRNLARLEPALAELKADPEVRALHRSALTWHRERAAALRDDPEMQDLIRDISAINLTQTERAAYAMALDMES